LVSVSTDEKVRGMKWLSQDGQLIEKRLESRANWRYTLNLNTRDHTRSFQTLIVSCISSARIAFAFSE
jgi:hypothetical protein